MGPFLWFILLFIICPAAGTLTLTLPNDTLPVNTNVTLFWIREPQDPQQFILQTVPPSPLENSLVDAQNSTGTVNLVFHVLGDFAVQAVDPTNTSNLLQETFTFSVVPTPTTSTTATTATTSPTSTSILSTIFTPPPSSSPSPSSSGASSSSSSSSKAGIIIAIVVSLVIVSALIFLAFFIIKRRRDNAIRRHTFHADLMTAPRGSRSPGPSPSLPPIPHTPTEDLYAVNRVFDIRPPPPGPPPPLPNEPTWLSRSRTMRSASGEMSNASTDRLVTVRPLPKVASPPPRRGSGGVSPRRTPPTMVDLNAARHLITRPLPPHPPILRDGGGMSRGGSVSASSRLQFPEIPPLNTKRLTQYRTGTDDVDVTTAGTTASAGTQEMRDKMREGIQKMRRMRGSGLQVQVPSPPYDVGQKY